MTMTDRVAFLSQWIAVNGAYGAATLPPPSVVTMTPAEIAAEFYSEAGLAAASPPTIDRRIMAL